MGKSFEKSTTQTSETVVVLVNKCLRSPHSILQIDWKLLKEIISHYVCAPELLLQRGL